MKPVVLADTGPLYAAVDPSDAHHQRAQQELKRLVRDKHDVIVTYPTLFETYTLVLRRLGNKIASNWLVELQTGALLLNPASEDYRNAMDKVNAFHDQPITLFDAVIAAIASRTGMEVWTYDHHFEVMRTKIWR